MALRVGELYALLKLEDSEFQRGLQRAEQDMRRFDRSLQTAIQRLDSYGNKLNQLGKDLTAKVTLPLAGLSAYLVKTASDAAETASKFEVSFGDMAEASMRLADQMARDQQRARVAIQNMMADAQAILAPMTENREAAAQMSAALAALAVDLGSFLNMSDQEAFDRLISGLLGSTQATERLGISLRDSQLQLEAQRLGIEANTAAMTEGEKILLRFISIMRQSADAQTDAIRTGASFSNQLKALQSDVADLAAEMGQELLPYALALVRVGRDLVAHWRSLSPEAKELAIQLAAIAAAAGPVALALSAVVRAAAGIGRALSLIITFAKANPWLLLGTLAATWALSLEEVRQKLEELGRAIGLGPLIDELEELGAAFKELMSFEVEFDPEGASAAALESQKRLYQQAMEEIQRIFREGYQGAAELVEDGVVEVADRAAAALERLAEDERRILQARRLVASARGGGPVELDILEDWLQAQERALEELYMAGAHMTDHPAHDAFVQLQQDIRRTADAVRELRAAIEQAELDEELARQAEEARTRFHREIEAIRDRLVVDLEGLALRGGQGAVAFGKAIAEAMREPFDEVEELETKIRAVLEAIDEFRRVGYIRTVADLEAEGLLDELRALSAQLEEKRFLRDMAELRRQVEQALSPTGVGAIAERLAQYRGEAVLPPWLEQARLEAIAAGDLARLAQLAQQHSLVFLDAQIEALDRAIDEMVRLIQDRAGDVNLFDLLASPELMHVLQERSRLAAERAATAWQYEWSNIQSDLQRAFDTLEVERLLAAVTGEEFDEATAKWRAVERAIWAVVRAGEEHGRTIEDVLPLVEQLVGEYGHLAQRAKEAVDPLAQLRAQLQRDLGPGLAIQRLITPAFDELQYQIDALSRAIGKAIESVPSQSFGEMFDALQPWIEQLQELQRRQREQLTVQDAVNSALDGFAQGLADGNRIVQDFVRLLRWEQGGLRFDVGGLWSLGANLLGQFVGSLLAGPRAQLPEPRRFEAPDPYMYGLAVAREQRSELEAELRHLQQRLAAERQRLAYEESSLWNRLLRQDILNYWRDRIRLTEQEIANLESALGSFDMQSFLGLDPGNIARAIESGFDMADMSRLGQSLEDVIRTALVRAWVTSEEMVRLQTRFRDLLQQVVDEFVQHGELRADALDPLRAVIAAIQERGEAFNEVLRRLGFTTEELNEQFSRMIYNIPQGYRVERAIFEAAPPRIPALATGGIVTRPTLAMVGEAGPEAVVPLNGQGFGTVNITIQRMEVQDGTDFGRRLDEELRRRGLVRAANVTAWGGRR